MEPTIAAASVPVEYDEDRMDSHLHDEKYYEELLRSLHRAEKLKEVKSGIVVSKKRRAQRFKKAHKEDSRSPFKYLQSERALKLLQRKVDIEKAHKEADLISQGKIAISPEEEREKKRLIFLSARDAADNLFLSQAGKDIRSVISSKPVVTTRTRVERLARQ